LNNSTIPTQVSTLIQQEPPRCCVTAPEAYQNDRS